MSERIRVLRFFTAWNDEKEERWLERMAMSGWHLVSGPLLYTFEQGNPEQVRYRLDYRPRRKRFQEYLRLCQDSGWEHVLQFAGWQYWRTALPDAPEIYTDAASRMAMYRRLFVVCLLVATGVLAATLSALLASTAGQGAPPSRAGSVVVLLLLSWGYILARLALHIRHLKRRSAKEN